jgi:hypothetical protein
MTISKANKWKNMKNFYKKWPKQTINDSVFSHGYQTVGTFIFYSVLTQPIGHVL